MKKDFSNITIATLVGILFVVTMGSSLFISDQVGNLAAITGAQTSIPTGVANVTVSATTYISLPVASIDFGSMENNQHDNTSDDSPAPFQLQNDGTINVNVTIQATDMFTEAPNPNGSYQFVCGTGELACPTGSALNWSNMSAVGAATQVIADLPYGDSGDQVEIDIGVTVPADESAGAKGSTVTFTATQA